jgi:sigma-E factor negative regulatory protein RseC
MDMIKEEAIVESTAGDKAVVRIHRSSACAACESRAACGVENDKEIRVEVKNELHANAGDHVEISMPAPSLFKMGMLVYLFPVLAMILGAGVGHLSAGVLKTDANLASIMGGVAALVISFGVLRGIECSVRSKPDYNPRMTRFIQPPTCEPFLRPPV